MESNQYGVYEVTDLHELINFKVAWLYTRKIPETLIFLLTITLRNSLWYI